MSTIPEVAVHGISLGSALTAGGVWTGVLTLIGVMWRSRVPMRKMALDASEELRKDLMTELNQRDATHAKVMKEHKDTAAIEMRELRAAYQRLEDKLELERATHAGELAVYRHKVNNLDQCLSMLLALIEENPAKAQAAAKRVQDMRAKQESNEVTERATIKAAVITAATAITL